jgi:hypothetical protein
MAVIGNAEDTIHGTYGSADTGPDDASDSAAHRSGDAVAFIGAILSASHDALSVAGMRQARQGQNDSGACKEQAAG